MVFGTLETVNAVLAPLGCRINTAFIERLNLTIRQHVAAIGRWKRVPRADDRLIDTPQPDWKQSRNIIRSPEVHIWTRPRCQGGFKLKKHVSVQMQSYIRPLGEDILWSSGPDEICASSPYHDRGLKGPVPDQG